MKELHSKSSEARIPFRKTLRFKLFVSYLAVVVVTILTTLVVHLWSAHTKTRQVLLTDAEEIATDLRRELELALEEGKGDDLSEISASRQLSTRHKILFLSSEPERESSPPLFRLSQQESEALKRGETLRGDAEGRLKAPSKAGQTENRPSQPVPGIGLRHFVEEPGPFVAVPVIVNGAPLGVVVVYHDQPMLWGSLVDAVDSLFQALLIALVLASILAFVLAKNLTRPLARMERVAEEFAQGNLAVRSDLERPDELGALARAFDGMAAEIEDNIETRTRLLSDVSHELGTPVSTSIATVEALLDGVLEPEEADSYLESVLCQLELLSTIVDDVTQLSRFESGQICMTLSRIDAEVPLRRAFEAARALAIQKKAVLTLSGAETGLTVMGDMQRITQVLKILILNAVHHNPAGTQIQASVLASQSGVTYSVADNGPKISQSDQKRLFERFYKASESRTRGESGSGLGLAIAQQILDGHNASLELKNTDDGKIFSFSLSRVEAN